MNQYIYSRFPQLYFSFEKEKGKQSISKAGMIILLFKLFSLENIYWQLLVLRIVWYVWKQVQVRNYQLISINFNLFSYSKYLSTSHSQKTRFQFSTLNFQFQVVHCPLSTVNYSPSSGIFSNNFTNESHHLATEGISTFSSGECALRIVGPIEIISSSGYFSRKSPHSSPA